MGKLNMTLGVILSRQEFDSRIFQFLDDGTEFDPTPDFNEGRATNDTGYNFTEVYLGVRHRFKTVKFTISPGLSAHTYGNRKVQFSETFEDNFIWLLPEFETLIQLKKSESLFLRHAMRNQFTNVTRFAEGLVLTVLTAFNSGSRNCRMPCPTM